MDSLAAFAMGRANRGQPLMVFDWEKAARLIKERGVESAEAGLADDWENTGGPIWRDGKPMPQDQTYVYLASTWAEPQLEIDGEIVECYRMQKQSPGWDAHTYWPPEALYILGIQP